MEKVIINAKGNKSLKEAIRLASVMTGKKSSSAFIIELLEKNEHVQKALKTLEKK